MNLIAPPYLQKDDQIALVAPAGFLEDEKPVIIAEQLLVSWGLKPQRGEFVLEREAYLAGSDAQRLKDLQNALDDPEIKAIWMLRGGYGTMRIIDKLDFTELKKNPKWIIGFSDVTALHNVIHRLGFQSIHGLMPVQLAKGAKNADRAIESLQQVLFGNQIEYTIPLSSYNKIGKAAGTLVGGNLSLLQSFLGSPNSVQTKGKILFIEDVGEDLYRIDRLLQSLRVAHFFEEIKGLIVGDFSDINTDALPDVKSYQELILEVVGDREIPILFDFPAGHIIDNRALVFGSEVIMSVGEFVSSVQMKCNN